MLLLIDTAFDCCQVGLWHADALLAQAHAPDDTITGRPRHDVALAPLIADMLHAHQLRVQDLDGVAVMTGPGRFTSLRVGIALARAVVLPTNTRLQGLATGDVLRHMLPTDNAGWLVAVKRGEVFAQTAPMAQPVTLPLDLIPAWLHTQKIQSVAIIGAGTPIDWVPDLVPHSIPVQRFDILPLNVIGQVAATHFAQPASCASDPVRPFYGTSTGAGSACS